MRGFEPAGGLLREPIRQAGAGRGFQVARVLTHWREIAGADLADRIQPVRIAYGRDGMGATLTVLVTGADAPLVQMQLPTIRERVNACYGYNAVARIRLTQTAPGGLAEPATAFRPAAPPPAAQPQADTQPAARAISRDVQDQGLRAALEALGEKILSRSQARKG